MTLAPTGASLAVGLALVRTMAGSSFRLGLVRQHLLAGCATAGSSDGRDERTNLARDRAAARLAGTEAGTRPYVPMDRGTGVALITGVGPGTGIALAEKFAEEGYKVAMLARTVSRLSGIEGDLTSRGLVAKGYACDVSDLDQLEAVVQQVQADFGKISVLIHNAVQAGGAGLDVLSWDEKELIGNFVRSSSSSSIQS